MLLLSSSVDLGGFALELPGVVAVGVFGELSCREVVEVEGVRVVETPPEASEAASKADWRRADENEPAEDK